MKRFDLKHPREVLEWVPVPSKLDTGEVSMLWELDLESRYRNDGGFTSPVDLNYLDVQVQIQWLSDRKCSLHCRAPGMQVWKNLHDAGYRGILAIDRYLGPVAAVNGVARSTWWIAVLTVYGASGGPRPYDANELMKAAAGDDVPRLQELLARGANIEAGDMIGTTALCCAAESGKLRAFELLLAKGANLKVLTSWEATLLHVAAAGGNTEIVSIAVSRGLDLNARDRGGHTALAWAISNRRAAAAEYLLRAGADPTAERGMNLCEEARLRLGKEHPVTTMLCRG
jgi:hypothetical protein